MRWVLVVLSISALLSGVRQLLNVVDLLQVPVESYVAQTRRVQLLAVCGTALMIVGGLLGLVQGSWRGFAACMVLAWAVWVVQRRYMS